MKLFKFSYIFCIIAFTIYLLLDTFLITEVYEVVDNNSSTITKENEVGNITITDDTYEDNNIKVNLKEYTKYNTEIYVLDVTFTNDIYLKSYLANNSYGKNITEYTSTMAKKTNAILAVNGDYYGVQEKGFVIRNGILYRSTSRSNQEDLAIYKNGSFKIINEDDYSANELVNDDVYNLLSFGPALVENSSISVSENDEVSKAMNSNPRTAIGQIDTNHYVFVVSDGRTSASEGLTLYELASFMQSLSCTVAYNLDGGGSSTMYFNGKVINNPTSNGNIKERKVSDIIYVGY